MMNKIDADTLKDFYAYTKKPNITVGDCWSWLNLQATTDLVMNKMNLVSGYTYLHFVPAKVIAELPADYTDQTGLYNYRDAQSAVDNNYGWPKELSVSQIRSHARHALRQADLIKE